MKILVLSDIHLELYRDPSVVIRVFPTEGYDAVVLAGDIVSGSQSAMTIELLCRHFAPHPIIFVRGNHELWRGRRQTSASELRHIELQMSNFRWLENETTVINGQKFMGTTLWFPRSPFADAQSYTWSDFRMIADFREWVYKANQEAVEFLRKNATSDSVVVTHYMPTERSVHPKYKGDPFNCFYVCDLGQMIVDQKPLLWIHGHTHESVDCMVGDTRVVCNPMGYPNEDNQMFSVNKIVEV